MGPSIALSRLRSTSWQSSHHGNLEFVYKTCISRLASSKTGQKSTVKEGFVIQHVRENDMIGPPDPLSNLRPIRIHIPELESKLEKQYRTQREEVQEWNQKFWANHNKRFINEREQFVKEKLAQKGEPEGTTLTADEMSVFYKQFLDGNWRTHVLYNKEWYQKNIGLMLLSFKVKVNQFFLSLTGRRKK